VKPRISAKRITTAVRTGAITADFGAVTSGPPFCPLPVLRARPKGRGNHEWYRNRGIATDTGRRGMEAFNAVAAFYRCASA
jgi:hypothetical protein